MFGQMELTGEVCWLYLFRSTAITRLIYHGKYIQDRYGNLERDGKGIFAADALPRSESFVGRCFRRPRCWAAGETPAPR